MVSKVLTTTSPVEAMDGVTVISAAAGDAQAGEAYTGEKRAKKAKITHFTVVLSWTL